MTFPLPLGDRIIVKPEESDKTTESGIIIQTAAKERPFMGEVMN